MSKHNTFGVWKQISNTGTAAVGKPRGPPAAIHSDFQRLGQPSGGAKGHGNLSAWSKRHRIALCIWDQEAVQFFRQLTDLSSRFQVGVSHHNAGTLVAAAQGNHRQKIDLILTRSFSSLEFPTPTAFKPRHRPSIFLAWARYIFPGDNCAGGCWITT